ncbi:MAG: membrane protein insertion efficiency factor YidD [Acidobacteria bacterium]|nr:membrane protein insertion efficiency factor YidD [Acidobacteriota bacterium]
MAEQNIFVRFSICCIINIWHGKIGNTYKEMRNIKCPFSPTCSNYAILALRKYGFFKGWYLSIRRIRRCKDNVKPGTIDLP